MARHVDQYITPVVGQQPLTPRCLVTDPVCEQPNEVFHGDLVAPVIHLDVVTIQVNRAVCIGIDSARESVAWIAGHVVREHENDLTVGDAESLDGAVDGEDIGEVAIVEPEARSTDQYGPVAGVLGQGDMAEDGRSQQHGQLKERVELHRVGGGLPAACVYAVFSQVKRQSPKSLW